MANVQLVDYENDKPPINAKYFKYIRCIHCSNQALVRVCDDEYWCHRCRDYVMVEVSNGGTNS